MTLRPVLTTEQPKASTIVQVSDLIYADNPISGCD
jgi:hypothetical protein